MKILLNMFLVSSPEDIFPSGMSRFSQLALEQGIELRSLLLTRKADNSVDISNILDQIAQAQGFWINNPYLLASGEIRQAFEARLAEGALAIAQLSSHEPAQRGSDFFEDLGLIPTSIRASSSQCEYGHPMIVSADRQGYEIGFRDPLLFQGVDQLVLQQANGILCQGGSQTVLAIPVEEIEPIDMSKDLFVELPRPELPVMASTSKSKWRGGRIIAMHAGVIHDNYIGPMGVQFPGIKGGDNEAFARNLIDCVAGARGPQLSWEEARSVITEYETAIALLVRDTLRRLHGENWFANCAPSQVAEKCIEAASRSRSAARPQTYLTLVQFLKILEKNWNVIGSALSAAGSSLTLADAKASIGEVNPIRNEAMHITKAVYGERKAPSSDEMATLRRHRDLMVAAERAIRAAIRGAHNG
jgi:hypothetical protein